MSDPSSIIGPGAKQQAGYALETGGAELALAKKEDWLKHIDRSRLDFDFEKVCSISLSDVNVYACLVCGRFFQGRGRASHAYFHSLDEGHLLFVHLANRRFYALPEGLEVTAPELQDIQYVMYPTFSKEDVARLDRARQQAADLSGKPYVPGFVGLNNIGHVDYVNVILQVLAHVVPLRNFFLLTHHPSTSLCGLLSVLVRQLWNPKAFKAHSSPHEILQRISALSERRFTMNKQNDPLDFLLWFLNAIHLDLGGSKTKFHTSIVQQAFQGRVRVESQKISVGITSASGRRTFETDSKVTTTKTPFMLLALDLPAAPLFVDELEANFIPQVPLHRLLAKYDGETVQELAGNRKRYKITDLPHYLILHIKRFTKKGDKYERNPTIVTFPLQNLDMSPYAESPGAIPSFYDLCANVIHDSESISSKTSRSFSVQVRERATDEWFHIQDLHVKSIERHLVPLAESYIQVWERRKIN